MEQNLYEAMFLVDAAKGGEQFPTVIQHISSLLERQGAHIERIEKWGESKLSYQIKHVDRGVYALVYFRAQPDRISALREDIQLSEELLRVLILKAEGIPEARGKLYTPQGELAHQEAGGEPQPELATAAEPDNGGGENKEQGEREPGNIGGREGDGEPKQSIPDGELDA